MSNPCSFARVTRASLLIDSLPSLTITESTTSASFPATCASLLLFVVTEIARNAPFKSPRRIRTFARGCIGASIATTALRVIFISNIRANSSMLERKSCRISASNCACSNPTSTVQASYPYQSRTRRHLAACQ